MTISQRQGSARTMLGLFVASTTGAGLACVLDTPASGALIYFILIFAGSYVFALLIGLPVAALLDALHWNSLAVFVLIFFLIGTVVFGLLNIIISTRMYGLEVDGITLVESGHMTRAGLIYISKNAMQLGALCAFGASIFWAVSVRQRKTEG